MNKADLAYKLTADVMKKYDLSQLEDHYGIKGGKLIVKIFNEIADDLDTQKLLDEPLPVLVDDFQAP